MPNKNRNNAVLVPSAQQAEAAIARHMHEILLLAGENPEREGLLKTPGRYARAFLDLTSGYNANFSKITNDAIFTAPDSGLVLVRDIELFSLCEHHLLPFFGKAHVAYLPDGKVIGLSKIPRIVDAFANRLQIQEKLTEQIAEELMNMLSPKGVAVFIEAYHMCIMMRGVEKQSSRTVTNCFKGAFRQDSSLRSELFEMIKTSDHSR